ncbi:MAG: DUF2007 domain-containing protein [Longimicrobiales bacterium]
MPVTCPYCDETIGTDLESCPACGCLLVERTCDRHTERLAEGRCVVCGRALCPECNQPQGRHFVCEEHAAIPLMSGWAQVYSAADDLEAELIRENLNAEGIEARVLSQRDHFSFVVDVGELDQVRVLVPAYSFSEAAELIEEHMNERGEVSFACPNCGEAYAPGDVRCQVCGAALPVPLRDWSS